MIAVLLAAILQASLPMRPIDKGLNSTMDDKRQAVVRTDAEWTRVWTQHAGEKTRPAVDFSKDMVLALFMGTRPTAGFATEIVGVREEAGTLIVSYKETRPSPESVAAQILTSPFHIVAVPRGTATAVKWERVN
jgi:PrcB C-terminal